VIVATITACYTLKVEPVATYADKIRFAITDSIKFGVSCANMTVVQGSLQVTLKPTNVEPITYLVTLYENGIPRETVRARWSSAQANLNVMQNVFFKLNQEEKILYTQAQNKNKDWWKTIFNVRVVIEEK
jgi:nitrate/TMAO reductase-like tetraheme cytochrome c subunit